MFTSLFLDQYVNFLFNIDHKQQQPESLMYEGMYEFEARLL